MIDMGSLGIRRLVDVCIVYIVVLVCIGTVGGSTVEKKPFYCLGIDICNRNGTDWQYCDENGEKRCRLCSKDEDTCFTPAMPANCTVFCKERLIEIEKVKGCPPFNQPTHGNHNGSGTGSSYGETVQLQCDAGYECDGSCTVTCGEFGQYAGSLRCTEKRCLPLLPPRNGYHSPVQHDYRLDEQVRISCNEGFQLEGDASATCTANGTWSINKMAACARPLEQEKRCLPLLPPRHGYHSPVQHDFRVDEQVRIRCNEGFQLEGDASATCTANGTWSINKMAACARPLEQGSTISWSWLSFGIGGVIGMLLCFMFGMWYMWYVNSRHSNSGTSDTQTREPLLPKEPKTTKTPKTTETPETTENPETTTIDMHSEHTDTNPSYIRNMLQYRSRSEGALSNNDDVTPPETPYLRGRQFNAPVGTESAYSSDSGIGTRVKEKEFIFNISVNQFNGPQNNPSTHVNQTATRSYGSQTTEPSQGSDQGPSGNRPDLKFPTEASRDKDGDCHGELQAHTIDQVDSVKPDQVKAALDTSTVHNPSHSLTVPDGTDNASIRSFGFSVPELNKIQPCGNLHAQPEEQSFEAAQVGICDGNQYNEGNDETQAKREVISSDHSTSNIGSPIQEQQKIPPYENMHAQPEEESSVAPNAIGNGNRPFEGIDETHAKGAVLSNDHSNGSSNNIRFPEQEQQKIPPRENMHGQPEVHPETVAIGNRNLHTGMEYTPNIS